MVVDNILQSKESQKLLASLDKQTPADRLIPILQHIQQIHGYLPEAVLLAVSERTNIPVSRVYGVATFYEQFHLEPRGRHTIRCCRGTACHVRGGPEIIAALEKLLEVKAGGTTEDMKFTFETVACLGTCFLAPVIMIDNDYYGHLTVDILKGILDKYE